MRIKTFEAATMEEALLRARGELGDDAVVLNAKRVKSGGVLGFGGANRIELMAAVDGPNDAPSPLGEGWGEVTQQEHVVSGSPLPEAPSDARYPHVSGSALPETTARGLPETMVATLISGVRALGSGREGEIDDLRAELRQLSSLVHGFLSGGAPQAAPARPLVVRLGVDEEIAREFLPDTLSITDPQELASVLASSLARFAQPPTLQQREVIAVIGPTGVGKTTTLAKLAAHFALEMDKSVAMVTADTFRIGAVEQLRTYARIMGIPLETAMSPEEVREGVDRHRDKDVVLIDTVGRSQRNEEHLGELKAAVQASGATQILLVVSASASPEIQMEVVERFAALSPTHLAITKLDESPNRGCLLNLPFASGLGISCTTAGQNVPQDIDFASASRLASYVTEVA